MKECKRLKCPKNKGLQGFARVRKRAKALPDDEVIGQINPVFMRVSRLSKKKVQQEYSKIVLDNARKYSIIPSR